MHIPRCWTYCLVVFVLLLSHMAVGGEEPPKAAKDVAELLPLNHYAGQWSTEMLLKSEGTTTGPIHGKTTGEWVHKGRFLRQSWTLEATGPVPELSGSTMMTYDPDQKTYRSWHFYSSDSVIEATGVWHDDTKTFVWTSENAEKGWRTVTTAKFGDPQQEKWSIVITNKAGETVVQCEGTSKRSE